MQCLLENIREKSVKRVSRMPKHFERWSLCLRRCKEGLEWNFRNSIFCEDEAEIAGSRGEMCPRKGWQKEFGGLAQGKYQGNYQRTPPEQCNREGCDYDVAKPYSERWSSEIYDHISEQCKEVMEAIADAKIIPLFVICGLICGYSIPSFKTSAREVTSRTQKSLKVC